MYLLVLLAEVLGWHINKNISEPREVDRFNQGEAVIFLRNIDGTNGAFVLTSLGPRIMFGLGHLSDPIRGQDEQVTCT